MRSPLFATAAGVAYGTVSVLIREVAARVHDTGLLRVPVVPALGVLGCVVVGAVCVQQAYAGGRSDTVLACQTVVDPMVGVLFGVFLLHELPSAGPATVTVRLACAALALAGVVTLARRAEPRSSDTATEPPMSLPASPALDRPLRIVVGADTFPPDINGASTFAHQLATGLAGRGHDVHVVCPSDTGPRRDETVGGVTVHRLRAHRTPVHRTFRLCPPFRTPAAVRDLLDRIEPDLVHVQAHFLVGRALVRGADARGVPIVATNHFMPENLFGHLRVPAWLRGPVSDRAWRDLAAVLRPARVVTAPTPTAVRMLRRYGVGGEAVAVSCGVDLERLGAPAPAGVRTTVLFVGRLDEEKRVHELLRAVALLPDRDLAVEIVGDGSCRGDLTALAARLGIADRVTFHGFVPEAELLAAYARCSVFCMPGIAELQSIATMEAMAAGKPVVAADAVALPHLVRPGRNGWLYSPGDVPGLAARLGALAADPALRERMGAASRDLVAAHDVQASLDRFESLYARALGVGSCGPVAARAARRPALRGGPVAGPGFTVRVPAAEETGQTRHRVGGFPAPS